MAINFPNSPSVNDIHVSGANRWQWNGSSWTRIGGISSDADVINSSNDNSTTTLYPVMVSGTGSQYAKIATSATKNISFDASEGDLTVGGNISVGGTITYEDVTNVDSIGVVTARAGVKVTGGDISVGTAGTISSAGNMTFDKPGAGIITATRFVGSGVSLTDVISGVGIRTAGGTVGWAATILDFRGPGVTTAYYSSVTGVGTINFTGGGGSASVSISETAPSSPAAGDMWWDSDVGNLQIYYTDANSSQWVTANNAGPQGPQGVQGAVGAQGAQGHQGVQGAVGAQGAQGHQGVQGAQGHQGRQGSVGIASLTISQTPPSSPAQGDMWWDSDDSTLGLYYNDGNSSQWVNINHGPSGAQGAQGATGAQGHQGVQGTAGTTSISNNGNNRIVTGVSGSDLHAEGTLTYDGTSIFKVAPSSATPAYIVGDSNRTSAGQHLAELKGRWNGNDVGRIVFLAGDDTSNKDDGHIRIDTTPSGGSSTERLRITSSGAVQARGDSGDAHLVMHRTNAAGSNGNTFGNLYWNDNNSNIVSKIRAVRSTAADDADLLFETRNTGGSATERLRITSAGLMGLGTNNPATLLHLNDSANSTTKLITLNASTARNNYIGINGSDNLEIAADEDNQGNTSSIRFRVDGSEKLRVLDTGGITFNGDTSTDNALNDFETGTWTATSREGTVNNSQTCRYTKIGNMVWVCGAVNTFSQRSGTIDVGITNLPFTVSENAMGSAAFYRVANTDDAHVGTLVNTNERIQFLVSSQGGSESWYYIDYEDLNHSTSQIKFSVWYRTTQ